jgi:hypothetical protein
MEDRALSPDMLCRDSEVPECRAGVTRRNSGRPPILVLTQKIPFGRKRRVWRTFCRLLAAEALAEVAWYKFY